MQINQLDHKTYLIIIIAAEVPWVDTLLHLPCAPQPPSSNTTTWVVLGAGDLLPEGGVAAQSGMLCGEHLDAIVTWI